MQNGIFHRREKMSTFILAFTQHMRIVMPSALNPPSIGAPLARYSHGMVVDPGQRLVFTSGQLAVSPDGTIPEGCAEQTRLCFANVAAILEEAAMGLPDIIRINAYVTDRAHIPTYMQVRDELFHGVPPASTLIVVSGFSRRECVVEVEVVAAKDIAS